MTQLLDSFPRRSSVPLAAACWIALFLLSARHASAQAAPAATWPTGVTAPSEQPLSSQQMGTNLTLNQGVSAIAAENELFQHFGFGLEATGGGETNFFGTQSNQETVAFAQFTGQIGLRLQTPRTDYFALYQPGYNMYPAFSEVNNFSQSFFQNLSHAISQRATFAWGLTASRYLSLNQFLPQNLAIGGIGVVVPGVGDLLRQDSFEVTNTATSLQYRYLISSRLTFTGSLTGGLLIDIPSDVNSSFQTDGERYVASGADFRLDYQWTPRDTVGTELTPIYIYGIKPSGHLVAETVQGTYTRQLTTTLQARVGAGPLFVQGSSGGTGLNETSYSVSAGLTRQIRQSQFSGSFSRALLVNFLSPSVLSNSVGFNAYLPIRKNWIFTGAANYTHESGEGAYGSETIYGGTAQIAYQVARNLQLLGRYSIGSQNYEHQGALAQYGFTRNQFGGGLRVNLGSPSNLGGTQ